MSRVPEDNAQVTSTAIPLLLRRGATAVAAGRVAIGVAALAWPSVPARPWVGAAADDVAARVFGRALGARDVALGLGALAALTGPATQAGPARAWIAAGALSDALDVVATLSSWRDLPRFTRWLVVASAGGAALAGVAGALVIEEIADLSKASSDSWALCWSAPVTSTMSLPGQIARTRRRTRCCCFPVSAIRR